ncbi:uncharacterized protein L3040_008130 [Drepanopeziza brunnea f. sp. 'multigermtubi']|uniref:uncharacterized protein n=1 Tax=Drepanopeziza brunnea f. sp. 'multigermtubi' TaxID=698441 RepID=UPI00239266CB|nr:hypothetical protein L3040_008130 [Drepanopeziza brunnea f. sp. 'multigermtubi']
MASIDSESSPASSSKHYRNRVKSGAASGFSAATRSLIKATNEFQSRNTDSKTQVILTLKGGLVPNVIVIFFYDGPDRPAVFDPFLNLDTTFSTVRTQTFASCVGSIPSTFPSAIYNESSFWGNGNLLKGMPFLSCSLEPFLKYGKYATDSAFPYADSPIPLIVYFAWASSENDNFWRGAMQQSVDHLTDVAKEQGIYSADMYANPNYSMSTYSGGQLYGPTNAARLRDIQARYDPKGQVGGWRRRWMRVVGGCDELILEA